VLGGYLHPNMNRAIQIYIGEDRIVLQPCYTFRHKYGDDGRFCGPPIVHLVHSASVDEILVAVDRTFAECQKDAPQPTDLKAVMQPLLAATGEKTLNAVTRSFAYISVFELDGKLVFSALTPEKGAFVGSGQDWRCNPTDRAAMAEGFRAAAAVAIEAQNLHNPPPLL
jgi:hypothetical protein